MITYSLLAIQDIAQVMTADPWARAAVGIQFVMSVFMVGMAYQQHKDNRVVQSELKETLKDIQEQVHGDHVVLGRHDERLSHLEGTP